MGIDKMTTVTLSLNDLIRIVVSTTDHLDSEEQDKIIQTFASKLYEWYDVPSVELSETLVNFGFYAHATCCQTSSSQKDKDILITIIQYFKTLTG